MRRIGFFLLVNFGMIITLSVLASVLGIQPYLSANGINLEALAVFALFWGMGGAFISLLISKKMAKWTMGLEMIEPGAGGFRGQLLHKVHALSAKAGLKKMPEVAIYQSPEVNAFATGPSRSNSLVAVSTGLLERMDEGEVEGVLGHEVAHIANGDMVTMTLVQGVVNAFVIFFAKVIAWAASNALRSNDDEGPSTGLYFVLNIVLQIVFGFLGMIVVAWFSRLREYKADQGGAQLAGREKMIAALARLKQNYGMIDTRQEALASMKISGKAKSLFSTHPDLDDRIARLRQGSV